MARFKGDAAVGKNRFVIVALIPVGCSNHAAPAKAAADPAPAPPHAVRYDLNLDDLNHVFGTLAPLAGVPVGEVIETN